MTMRAEPTLNPSMDQFRHQFWLKHGGDAGVSDGSWIYFDDGATMERSPYGFCKEPPDDDYLRLKLQIIHHELKLQREIQHFDDLKKGILASKGMHSGLVRLPGMNDADAKKELKRRQKAVKGRRTTLAWLREELEEVKPVGLRRPIEPEVDYDYIKEIKSIDV